VPRLRNNGVIPLLPLPHVPTRHVQCSYRLFYFYVSVAYRTRKKCGRFLHKVAANQQHLRFHRTLQTAVGSLKFDINLVAKERSLWLQLCRCLAHLSAGDRPPVERECLVLRTSTSKYSYAAVHGLAVS
jgi:hypothetical protein